MYDSAKFYQNQSFYPFLYKKFVSDTIYIITDIYKIIHKKPGKQVSELFASGNSSQPYLTMRLVTAAVAVTAAATVVVATAAIAAAAVVGRAAIAATSTAIAVKAAAATAEDQDENQNPPVIVTVHK